MHNVLVTGSSGLVGSEAVTHYDGKGWFVHGVDNNMRAEFFGSAGDTQWNLERLRASSKHFQHHELDVRDREGIADLFKQHKFNLVLHLAAQPSHDRASQIPTVDFDVNAVGTMNLLEAARIHSPEAVFIFMSTNKVYGDAPNELPLVELPTRWEYARPEDFNGIGETCRVDQCLHSLFGASKLAADVLVQEYGRYYGMQTGVFRGGCLTGPNHSSVELHGFLSYLVKVAVRGGTYSVFGYKGKQVRDQLHSVDVIAAFEAFCAAPRPGEVYNLGGGRDNAASVLECIQMLEERLGHAVPWKYVDKPRRGDHICYISDLRKLTSHFPNWRITRSLPDMLTDMLESEVTRNISLSTS